MGDMLISLIMVDILMFLITSDTQLFYIADILYQADIMYFLFMGDIMYILCCPTSFALPLILVVAICQMEVLNLTFTLLGEKSWFLKRYRHIPGCSIPDT
jgi:hypothetical protein